MVRTLKRVQEHVRSLFDAVQGLDVESSGIHTAEGVLNDGCGGRDEVIGGDRETLTPGRHFVENCRIHDFGRIDRTYTPAVQLEGVGNRVVHELRGPNE